LTEEDQNLEILIYVNEACDTLASATDWCVCDALLIDYRQTENELKKDGEAKIGVQPLDLKLPFREIRVLLQNLDFIKREIGLENVQVLSSTNPHEAMILLKLVLLLK
jgi:hypothetical protein